MRKNYEPTVARLRAEEQATSRYPLLMAEDEKDAGWRRRCAFTGRG
jgi:hypothetical protein